MKSTLFSLVTAAALIMTSCGTTYTSTSDNAAYNVDVPSGIRTNFIVSYPDATNIIWNRFDMAAVPIDWEMSGWTTLDADDYVVSFNMGDDLYYAYYDSNGNLIGTAYAITDHSRLPFAVSSLLRERYQDYTVESVQREIHKSQTAYEVKLKRNDNSDTKIKLLVDPSGNVLKEKLKD